LKNKGMIILIALFIAVLVFAGIQFRDNQKMESYLNKQLNERLEMFDLQVDTIHFVTGKAIEEKEITRMSLNEIHESLEMLRMKSLQVENLARGLNMEGADQLHGVTHNTSRFMEHRLQKLLEEVGDKEHLTLQEDTLRILQHIHDTSGEWKKESDTFVASERKINKPDWVRTLIRMQKHSAEYQKVMDE
jgi:altronate dehydratase